MSVKVKVGGGVEARRYATILTTTSTILTREARSTGCMRQGEMFGPTVAGGPDIYPTRAV